MAPQKFSKFIRPEVGRPGPITDRDLDILEAVLRLPVLFDCPAFAPPRRE